MLGYTVGQYRVTGLIGQGGMGAVYAAEHTLLGRPAAIKVLLPELCRNQDIVTRFFNEAKAATAIRHPSIVEIYDFGWAPDGSAYIVMEHLQGEALSRRAQRGPMPWHVALGIARQISGALAAAHGKGIVHRDLKPDNIFLVPDPEVPGGERIKLLDFGIAKLAGDGVQANMTRTGAVMGTPTYMAPEQCRGVAIDSRADLYSLGCIVFELCGGRAPFVGEGTGDVLAAHIYVPPPALSTIAANIPPAVEALLQRLLAKAPNDRTPNAETLIREIDEVLGTNQRPATGMQPALSRPGTAPATPTTLSGASGVRTAPPTGHGAEAPRSKRGMWLGLGGAAIAAAIVVVAVVAGGGGKGEDKTAAAEPAKTEPAKTEPAAAEPAKTEPAKTEPAKTEPAKTEPAKTEPAKTEQVKTEPAKTEPVKTEPAKTEPAKTEPATVAFAIDSVPAGATVLLGKTVLGKTPYTGTLPRGGEVTLVVKASGFVDKKVVVSADKDIDEHVKLAKASAPKVKTNRDQSVNPFGN